MAPEVMAACPGFRGERSARGMPTPNDEGRLMTTSILRVFSLLSLSLFCMSPGFAQDKKEEHEHFEAHGGVGKEAKDRRFEIVFRRDAVRIYVSDKDGKPVDLAGGEGTVQVRFRQRSKNALSAKTDLVPAKDGEPGYLEAKLDLAKVEEGAGTATISLTKLPGGDASFQEPFKLARISEWACPMNCVEPSKEAGKCAKCKMDLVKRWFIYACPAHEKVTSQEPGKCWVDQKALVKKVSEGEDAHHGEEGHGEGAEGHGHGKEGEGHGHGGHGH